MRLHCVLRVLCEQSRRYPTVACLTCGTFLGSFVPQQGAAAFVRSQARQDAPMLPRVLHLKEVALLLYQSIARGEPSWVRRPSGVRIRIVRSLVSLLSLLLSRHPHPFLSLALSSVSSAAGVPHASFLPFHRPSSHQPVYFGKVEAANHEEGKAREEKKRKEKYIRGEIQKRGFLSQYIQDSLRININSRINIYSYIPLPYIAYFLHISPPTLPAWTCSHAMDLL